MMPFDIPSILDPRTFATVLGAAALFAGLLYILRMKSRSLEVPYLKLWIDALPRAKKSRLFEALKRLVSYLVTLAILALILLTVADPDALKLRDLLGLVEGRAEPHKVVIVVDTSPSMSAGDVEGGRMVQAKAKAMEVVDALSIDDLAMAATMEDKVYPLTTFVSDKKLLVQSLMSLQTGLGSSSSGALASFLAGIQTGGATPDVVVISDFSWLGDGSLPAGITAIKIGASGDNVAVTGFNIRAHLDDPLTYDSFYMITNYGIKDRQVTLSLYSSDDGTQGVLFHSEKLAIPAGATHKGQLNGLQFSGSAVKLLVESDVEDPFPLDNTAYAVLEERHQLKILVASPGNLFLYAALLLRENLDITFVEKEDITTADLPPLDGFDAVFLDGIVPPIPKKGNIALFGFGGPDDPFPEKAKVKKPDITDIAGKHPVMKGLKLADVNIKEASIPTVGKDDTVLASTAKGEPIIVARQTEDLKLVNVRFGIIESDFPLRYSFPLFFINVINWFFPELTTFIPSLKVGAYATVILEGTKAGDDVQVTAPDGSTGIATYGPDGLSLTITENGVYLFSHAGKTQRRAASFIDAAESSIAPSQKDLPSYEIIAAEKVSGNPLANPEPWTMFALGALCLLLLEWITYQRRITV